MHKGGVLKTEKDSIIIIGAGLAGLSAGCYAQMNGYKSRIFEYHSKPGGVASSWKRGEFLIDGGIHFLMGHRPGQNTYNLYRELGADVSGFTDLGTYCRFIDQNSGYNLEITRYLDLLAKQLKSLSAADAAVIDEIIAISRDGRGVQMFGVMENPPELMTTSNKLSMFWEMRKYFKYFTGKYAQPVGEYARTIKGALLRRIIENMFMSEVPVWFVALLLTLLADNQIALLEGGCRDFVGAIENRYKALGGEIVYNAKAEEILVRNNSAAGIRLNDGSKYEAGVVVSAADGYSTIFKLLGGRYVDEKTRTRYQDWRLINPTVIVSYGVARTFEKETPLNIVFFKEPFLLGKQSIDGISLRFFNYSGKFAPPGKTVVQVMFETSWDYWSELRKDSSAYEAEKEKVADEILKRLELNYPGISQLVEVTDVSTPYTTWRYTLNRKGAYMGWLPTPDVITSSIPRTLPGLGNFYMAGQWIVPGGGVPPCLYSGRHVVQILCSKNGKTFQTSKP